MNTIICKFCPCGSQISYQHCCGRYIDGKATANSPEALMRSRYSAYTLANIDYIAKTMQGPAAKGFDYQLTKQWAESVEWRGLEVIKASIDLHSPTLGTVEFKASYYYQNQLHIMHELSQFQLIEGHWYYIKGQSFKTPSLKIGRNDSCPCNSGKKFKKCCG